MTWKHLSLSVTGKSHRDRNEPGQDYCRTDALRFSDRDFFIGLAADGAGSTTHGGVGAEIACETLYLQILSVIRKGDPISSTTDEEVRAWVTASREAIAARAEGDGQRIKNYACTLIGVVAANDQTLYFQIGDGCIVTGDVPGTIPYSGRNRVNTQTQPISFPTIGFWSTLRSNAKCPCRTRSHYLPTASRTWYSRFPRGQCTMGSSGPCLWLSGKILITALRTLPRT